MLRKIAVDAGKYDTKSAMRRSDGTNRELVFPTRMDSTNKSYAAQGSYHVQYDGQNYIIGEQAEKGSAVSSKAELIHRIATYTAISQLADNNDEIFVVVGCPLAICENQDKTDAYLKFIFPQNDIQIMVNGVQHSFHIKKSIAAAEGTGIIVLDESLKNDVVGIIDIGGLNINCCVYDRGTAKLSTLFTDNFGSNVLREGLKKELFVTYGEDIPDYLMQSVLTDGYLRDNLSASGRAENSEKIISDFKLQHVRSILHKCQEHSWDLKHMSIAFVGGSAELLKNEIKQVLPFAKLYDDSAMLNARGFLKMIAG